MVFHRNYQRTVDELRELAVMFWPEELSVREAEASVLPKLLQTQDQFIAVLGVGVSRLDALFQIIDSSTLPARLFLKHLVVLSDFGGEMLQRVNAQFPSLFPDRSIAYLWGDQVHTHSFQALPFPGVLNNERIGISGRKVLQEGPLTDLAKDIVALLLFGSSTIDQNAAQVLAKCEIGSYLGQPGRLARYIKQRYLWVSRITGGAKANSLGQIAQAYVREYLQTRLSSDQVEIRTNGHLPGVTHTISQAGRLTTFDLVVSRGGRHVAIEITFQVTTNSTIERKAGQARARFEQVTQAGHRIAYVIDGAGNIQRESAISTLCAYSHCTVAFTASELDILCEFVSSFLAG